MKIKIVLLGCIASFALLSCSDDNEVANNAEKEKAYFNLSIGFPELSSAAKAPSSMQRSNTNKEEGDGYQTGLSTEQRFQNVAVVLVSATDKVTDYVTYTLNDFSPEGNTATDDNLTNPTQTSKNYVTKQAKLVTKGASKVYVFLNPTAQIATDLAVGSTFDVNKEMTKLDAVINKDGIAADNKFLMGNATAPALVTIDGTVTNPTVVTVNVERAVAKLVENTTQADLTFIATNDLGLANDAVKVKLTSYDYNNLNKRSFLLSKLANRTDAGLINGISAFAGNYYVDPNFATPDYDVSTFTFTPNRSLYYNEFFVKSGSDVTKPFTGDRITYSLENTMISNEQYDNKTTSIVYKADVLLEGAGTSATFYTYKNKIYKTYEALTTAYDADYTAGALATVFTKTEATTTYPSTTATIEAFNTKLYNKGIRCYHDGVCFYRWLIKHFEQTNYLGRMEFGIVRNNVYYLAVQSISNIGEPWIPNGPESPLVDTDGDGNPDTKPIVPDETEQASMVLSINVLPWTVRQNDIVF